MSRNTRNSSPLDHEGAAADNVRMVAEAVESNTELLTQLVAQVADLQASIVMRDQTVAPLEDQEDPVANELLRNRIDDLELEVDQLQVQNRELAAKLANTSVRQAVSETGTDESLSWEDRKKLILQQMEDDTFDAETFVGSMNESSDAATASGSVPLEERSGSIDRLRAELEHRDQQIAELQCLLDDQSQTHEGGLANGAAAIAELIDSDELVRQERERLQMLQDEWEEKFRSAEIEASLERAKLSRERLELANKQTELEHQIENLRQERRLSENGTSRKWLLQLGLADDPR